MIYNLSFIINISIHAPRKGERHSGSAIMRTAAFISIHAPRKGERLKARAHSSARHLFQSTLPARGSDYTNSSMTCLA